MTVLPDSGTVNVLTAVPPVVSVEIAASVTVVTSHVEDEPHPVCSLVELEL